MRPLLPVLPPRLRLGLLALALCAGLVPLAGCGGGGASGSTTPWPYRGSDFSQGGEAPDFALTDQHGRTVSLSGQRGHWVIVNFLYVSCPDVCPVIADNVNAVLRTPVGKRAGLRVLTVSVDPDRDTPDAVRTYARNHRLLPAYHYLMGTRDELEPVWDSYYVGVRAGAQGTIDHSASSFLIDPEGRERLRYDSRVQTADIVHDLGLLVREGGDG